MRIVILGGRGQLGRALCRVLPANLAAEPQISVWNRPAFDIATPQISTQLQDFSPDLVINSAAWTDVDGAESNPDLAYAANMLGPHYVAKGCRQCGATMIHISTNEVFAGHSGRFYREYDQPNPVSTYARSKLAGEQAAASQLQNLYIVRVAWLYGAGHNNFPAKIIAAAENNRSLRVVNDEFGNPTYADDVACAIGQLVQSGHYGIYHLVNEGRSSRFEFARHVLARSGFDDVTLTPVSQSEWLRPATPPAHAVLVNQAAAALGITLRSWEDALSAYMETTRDYNDGQ